MKTYQIEIYSISLRTKVEGSDANNYRAGPVILLIRGERIIWREIWSEKNRMLQSYVCIASENLAYGN